MARAAKMNVVDNFKVSGLKELSEAINGLDTDLATRAVRKACEAALEPTKTRAESMVPVDYGELKSTFRIRGRAPKKGFGKFGKDRVAEARLTVGNRKRDLPGHYALQVEYGTPERGIAPAPFLVPAFKQTNLESLSIFRRALGTYIRDYTNTQIRRMKRKLKK